MSAARGDESMQDGRGLLVGRGWILGLGTIAAIAGATASAENLDAGKSGAALFSSNCTACHRTAVGLAKGAGLGVAGFLRQHYTTGPETANELARYLASVGAGSSDDTRRRGKQGAAAGGAERPPASESQPRRGTVEPDANDQKLRRTARPAAEPVGEEPRVPASRRRARPDAAEPAD